MQALADLALRDAALRREVVPIIKRLTATGTAATRVLHAGGMRDDHVIFA